MGEYIGLECLGLLEYIGLLLPYVPLVGAYEGENEPIVGLKPPVMPEIKGDMSPEFAAEGLIPNGVDIA